jgi:hypothetical protein
MKYAAEVGSSAMPSFIKIGRGIRKLTVGGIHEHRDRIVTS